MAPKTDPLCGDGTIKVYRELIADGVFDEVKASRLRDAILCDLVIDQTERDIYLDLVEGRTGVTIDEKTISLLKTGRGYSTIYDLAISHRAN